MDIHLFNWVQSHGDTVKEKCETLFRLIQGCVERIEGRIVIMSPEIGAIIETIDQDFFFPDAAPQTEPLQYAGISGCHAPSRVSLYKSADMQRNDVVILGRQRNCTVVIKNKPSFEGITPDILRANPR